MESFTSLEKKPSAAATQIRTMSPEARIQFLKQTCQLSDDSAAALSNWGVLSSKLGEAFIENPIGSMGLPLGIANHFVVNGEEVLVPMAIEESSVVAAASFGAKLAAKGGGFRSKASLPIMTGQVELRLHDKTSALKILEEEKDSLIAFCQQEEKSLLKRGGGTKDLEWYSVQETGSLVVLLHIATCDAMGANIVNRSCERLANRLLELLPEAEMGLRILTNLCLHRMVEVRCQVPTAALSCSLFPGKVVAKRIEAASNFAQYDSRRACTHNKGIMNGIDAVVLATGNDWRATEAGAHAYATTSGHYKGLSHWEAGEEGWLHGFLKMPLALGTVGGLTRLHPTAKACLEVLGSPGAACLTEIVAAVGLAQNLAALRALAAEGIEKGHMNLHDKNLALFKKHPIN